MSIEQTDTVDFVGVNNSDGSLRLTISDHLPWDDEGEHLLLLQEKINTYLRYIESGEIYERYPDKQEVPVSILVTGKYKLSHDAEAFFEKAKEIIEDAGFSLDFRFLED